MAEENDSDDPQQTQWQVAVQKIYIRDASIEVPDAPRVFTEDYQPEVNVDLHTQVNTLSEETHEISVTVTVTATQAERTAYIVEVQQTGIFEIQGFNDEERNHVLGAYCPSILFAYVRESVGDMVQRAGFPHFLLQPVNFEALYAQHQANAGDGPADASQATH